MVTGAGAGIGREVASSAADQGADIIAFSLEGDLESLGAAVRGLGRRYVSNIGDVTNTEHVAAIVALAERELGGVDVLVNSAGIAIIEPALETKLSSWRRTLDVEFDRLCSCARKRSRRA